MKFIKKLKKLFVKEYAIIYFVDDDTVMPIVTDDFRRAVEIVQNELDGDMDRITPVIHRV
jgi:hypothetical protein